MDELGLEANIYAYEASNKHSCCCRAYKPHNRHNHPAAQNMLAA